MGGELVHWNLRGIKSKANSNYSKKVSIITNLLNKPQSSMVINLQETHLNSCNELPKEWVNFSHVYRIISTFATDTDRFGGITCFINKLWDVLKIDVLLEGRAQRIKCQIKASSEIVNIVSIYGTATGSSREKAEFFENILLKIKEENLLNNTFIIGDFNFVNSSLDRNTNKLLPFDISLRQCVEKK